MHEITTSIDIDAPPDRVWDALLDFPAYIDWNPFIRKISGFARAGERLTVHILPPGGKGMTFHPRVLRSDPRTEFRWLGHMIVPGIFDGEHFFRVEPLAEGQRSRFVHGERFTGLLVPLLRRRLDEDTRFGFEAMNRALKSRVEERAAKEA